VAVDDRQHLGPLLQLPTIGATADLCIRCYGASAAAVGGEELSHFLNIKSKTLQLRTGRRPNSPPLRDIPDLSRRMSSAASSRPRSRLSTIPGDSPSPSAWSNFNIRHDLCGCAPFADIVCLKTRSDFTLCRLPIGTDTEFCSANSAASADFVPAHAASVVRPSDVGAAPTAGTAGSRRHHLGASATSSKYGSILRKSATGALTTTQKHAAAAVHRAGLDVHEFKRAISVRQLQTPISRSDAANK
uniref:Rho-GAP domain-containing protein n=1 Tax=Macrostomum lignano TaxID=282301 RepID=A0A1I8FMN0_9PLAT